MYDYDVLEFEEFKEYLKKSFVSSFAADALDASVPLESAEDIYGVQREVAEAIELASHSSWVENDEAFHEVHSRMRDDNFFAEPLELVAVKNFLNSLYDLKAKLLKNNLKYLKDKVESLNCLPELKDRIFVAVDDNGEIRDGATDELRAVREDLRRYRGRIRKVLNDTVNSPNADKFIQDKVVVLRNGRYTIPCKTNFGQYIHGIIQDKSTSGQTLYIEPASAVPMNNALQEAIIKESEEISKIIGQLTALLNKCGPALDATSALYGLLALRLETGRFYRNTSYCFGEIADHIEMRAIHHPLLILRKESESVPVDFELKKGASAVITGPNTGGKTAALKSVGINHVITYFGLPVFGKSGKFALFSSIEADIGDKQSIVMDLSTFSSHMLNIKKVLEESGKDTLVLFDELGTGTEPREGACLAVAVLKYLERKGATSVITTHYPEVKNYALNSGTAEFYAVDFDYETFAPRYRLLRGVLGKSDPILIARRLGFGKDIIAEAEEELSKYKSSVEMKVEELNRLLAEAAREKRILEERERSYEEKERLIERAEKELKKKLDSRELELLEETYALLQRGKRLATEKMKASPSEISTDIEKTAEKIEKLKKERTAIRDVSPGDKIFLERYHKTAKILAVEGDFLNLDVEGMKVRMRKCDAVGVKVKPAKENTVRIAPSSGAAPVRRELLLVGKRVEEAFDMLDKFLDSSILAGYDKIYIIHGRGSGILKNAVRELLRNSRVVRRYYEAPNDEGGAAVTVAEL